MELVINGKAAKTMRLTIPSSLVCMKLTMRVVAVVVLALLAPVLDAEAQQAVKIPRIGYLSPVAPTSNPDFENAFREGLRELGYVEGRNIAIEYRWAEGKYERLPELAAELVRLKVEVILAATTPAMQATKSATRTIPIVFTLVSDPVASGYWADDPTVAAAAGGSRDPMMNGWREERKKL